MPSGQFFFGVISDRESEIQLVPAKKLFAGDQINAEGLAF